MASKKTCDICDASTDEQYAPGWGMFIGFDPQNTGRNKDACPRCAVIIGNLLVELRKRLAPVTTTGAPPDLAAPGNIGVEGLTRR